MTELPDSRSDKNETPTIAFVGDSLVQSGDWSAWLPQCTVLNFGVAGDATVDVLDRLDAIIEAQPDEVLMLIGTNDLGRRSSVEHLVRTVEMILVELRRQLPGTRMLVHSVLPRAKEFARNIQDANIHVRQFCATVHAQYLDLWPTFALENGQLDPRFSADALHLNADGYEAWVSELVPALDRLRDNPPMSSPTRAVVRDEYSRPL